MKQWSSFDWSRHLFCIRNRVHGNTRVHRYLVSENSCAPHRESWSYTLGKYIDDIRRLVCTKYLDRHRQTNQPSERESKPANRHQKGPGLFWLLPIWKEAQKRNRPPCSAISLPLSFPHSLSIYPFHFYSVDLSISISPSLHLSLSFCSNKLPLFSLIGVLFLVNKTTTTSSTAGENKKKSK